MSIGGPASVANALSTSPPPSSGEATETVLFPLSAAEYDLEEFKEREREQDISLALWRERVSGLWGTEPPYEEQPEDRSDWILGTLFYRWIGYYIRAAAREQLTEDALPKPTKQYRAYNAGVALSAELQRQWVRRHAWDGHVGARVGLRCDDASDGVLRWIGVVQQYNTPGQLYAGVEWRVAPSRRPGGCVGRCMSWLMRCGRSRSTAPEQGPGAYHRGEVDGEHLFDPVEDDTVLTCERVEDVVFRLGISGELSQSASTRRFLKDLPLSVQRSPRLVKVEWAVWTLFRQSIMHIVALGIFRNSCELATPLLLKYFVTYLNDVSEHNRQSTVDPMASSASAGDPFGASSAATHYVSSADVPDVSWRRGIWLSALLFVAMIGSTLASNKQYHVRRRSALQVRNALSASMFEKVFTMSVKATHHPAFNTGRLTNLMSTDVETVSRFLMMFWLVLSTPFMLVIILYQLYLLLGMSVCVGTALMLLLMPLQTLTVKGMSSNYRSKAQATDHRVKATTEFLSGIRVAKFMSWEPFFICRIEKLRDVELTHLKKLQYAIMMVFFQLNATPGLVVASVFFTFSVTGHILTPTIVFPAIALFNLLMSTVSMLPFALQLVTKILISKRRLNMFFDADDERVPVIEDISDGRSCTTPTNLCRATADQSEKQQALTPPLIVDAAAEFVNANLSTYVVEELKKPAGAMDDNSTPANPDEPPPLSDAAPSSPHPHSSSAPSTTAEPNETNSPSNAETSHASHGDAPAPAESPSPSSQKSIADIHFNEDSIYVLKAKTLLADVDLRLPRGQLTVVLGPTGSGKSTLLDALIGALAVTRGRVACSRSVAYVPQQPWIMNATLRDNIVFFGASDAATFERAVRSSQLATDLAMLANGAETEIGEKGINLSGGQKARVSLARAVYADRDVYVMDDPLSALDAHVGERVMRECVCGVLAGKTRVLATHQVSAAAYADQVVLLEEGRVAFHGSYAAYRKFAHLHYERSISGLGKASMYAARTVSELAPTVDPTRLDDVLDKGSVSKPLSTEPTLGSSDDAPYAAQPRTQSVFNDPLANANSDVTVMESGEEKAVGAVPWAVYRRYVEACGGRSTLYSTLVFFLVTEALSCSANLWLSLWSGGMLDSISASRRLFVYVAIVLVAIVASPSRDLWCYTFMRRASYNIHAGLLRVLARARLSFFDVTPRGRLINRLSRDMGLIDWDLPASIDVFLFFMFYLFSYLGIMITSQPFILVVLVPAAVVYGRIFVFYCAASREVQRLLNISNSPVFCILSEILTGRWTISTYGRERAMMQQVLQRLDDLFACSYMRCMGSRWLSVRVELLGNVAVSGLALLGVLSKQLPWMHMNLGLIALSISNASSITKVLSRFISVGASVQASMNCVERVLFYTDNAESEVMTGLETTVEEYDDAPPLVVDGIGESAAPEAAGSIVFDHVDMRYRPGLPLVLRDVCFAVAPGQKVGVVGRTGSGKSTLLLAFLRLVEVCGGRMLVCGRDARDYGVRELRQLFSMIPQDPLLFDGTVRSNVDPFGHCDDAAVWCALRQVGMEERVRDGAGGLDGRVQEGGANYSVGQRQLLCLARALLKRGSAFLLMDEATANVDPALDRQIQRTVQHVFRNYTVVTIAHRLHTVAAYDAILVMDQGRVLEFGSPRELVEREGSAFSELVKSLSRGALQAFHAALEENSANRSV